ncbi:MAG: sensor histidine kinase, partial [Actinomycetota bacterium]|nr:sensor histidine kinase [Actinomycetota bacterium]
MSVDATGRAADGSAVIDQLPERTAEERTAVVLRAAVVAAAALLLVLAPEQAGDRLAVAVVLVAVAAVYAAVLLVGGLRGPLPVKPAVLTGVDGLLVVLACGLTGGAQSLMVAALPLVAIAASLRTGPVVGRLAAVALGAGYTAAVVLGSESGQSLAGRLLAGLWWTGFLLATAVLVGVLVRLLERQLAVAAESRARAETEHERYLSERAQGRARLDGARVVLHEFRTPVASLTALSADLAADRLSDDARRRATGLLAEHAAHLRDMLDGLADLAVSDGSPLGRVRPRRVDLDDLAAAVLDAAGVAE